jgi:DNA polymerase-3 subunit epsilon
MMQSPQSRTQVTTWARELLKDGAVFLDFETTDIKDAEIVQVGIVDVEGIHPKAMEVHGITPQMVKDAPTFEDIYVTVSSSLAGRPVVAYNMPFDRGVLTGVCERRHLPMPRVKVWTCAMRAYATYYGKMSRGSYQWQSLSNACIQQKIVVANAHDAVGDCLMTLELVKKMAQLV